MKNFMILCVLFSVGTIFNTNDLLFAGKSTSKISGQYTDMTEDSKTVDNKLESEVEKISGHMDELYKPLMQQIEILKGHIESIGYFVIVCTIVLFFILILMLIFFYCYMNEYKHAISLQKKTLEKTARDSVSEICKAIKAIDRISERTESVMPRNYTKNEIRTNATNSERMESFSSASYLKNDTRPGNIIENEYKNLKSIRDIANFCLQEINIAKIDEMIRHLKNRANIMPNIIRSGYIGLPGVPEHTSQEDGYIFRVHSDQELQMDRDWFCVIQSNIDKLLYLIPCGIKGRTPSNDLKKYYDINSNDNSIKEIEYLTIIKDTNIKDALFYFKIERKGSIG